MPDFEGCTICRIIRFYLLLAVPLVAILGLGALGSEESSAGGIWFARVELIDFLAVGSLLALVFIVSYRAYREFWLPKKRKEAIETLLRTGGSHEDDI